MKQFDDILHKAAEWRKENNEVALATVVSTWGSSPRPIGSQMVVSENLDIYGSVSGGCIESSVITAAQEIMRTGKPKLLKFGVSNSEAWEVGLTCGGKVEVFVEKIGEKKNVEHGDQHEEANASKDFGDYQLNLIEVSLRPI